MWTVLPEDALKLVLAIMIGGALGAERELRNKAAGFRTMICICVGATLFTLFSQRLGLGDPGRVAAQIVSGIGFLGAGVIWRDTSRVSGLTTAATIWLTAALGMGLATGAYGLVFLVTAVVLVVLVLFPRFELMIEVRRRHRVYECILPARLPCLERLRQMVAEHGQRVLHEKLEKRDEHFHVTLETLAPGKQHEALTLALLDNPDCLSVKA